MPGTPSPEPASERLLGRLLLVLIGASVVLRCRLVFRLNIDGGQFRFLCLVYEHLRGRITTPFMTCHAQLFAWFLGSRGTRPIKFSGPALSCSRPFAGLRAADVPDRKENSVLAGRPVLREVLSHLL